MPRHIVPIILPANAPVHTRAEAAAAGLAKYWTGVPCGRGHRAPRYTNSGACRDCVSGYQNRYKGRPVAMRSRDGQFIQTPVWHHPIDGETIAAFIDALLLARGCPTGPDGAPMIET